MKVSAIKLFIFLTLFSSVAFAQTEAKTKFPLGNGVEKWGVPLKIPDSELSLRLGARFQSLTSFKKEENLDTGHDTTSQDFQARRVRLQFQADLANRGFFYMDLRNDNANQEDEGERSFNIGDAYVNIPLMGSASHALRVYRAKVDVSRTETVSSSESLFVNRSFVADEAAQFVSHNRRATNIQLNGNFDKKLSYHIVAGDGVFSGRFRDAKGQTVDRIEKQNFMVGAKLRLHPFEGWEDLRPSETYFGEGKHISVGIGAFNTSKIRFVEGANFGNVSRNLINAEFSAHYNELSLSSEYFRMNGVIEDHTVASFNKGAGEGHLVQGEWVFTNFHYLAPFARYEYWNRFIQSGDYDSESNLYGINWYLDGNRFRVTLAYEKDLLDRDISGSKDEVEAFHIATMWLF